MNLPTSQNLRQYIHPALLAAAVVLVLGGVIALWAAVAFEGYIAAMMLFALAGISYVGAREWKEKEAKANTPPPAPPPPHVGADNTGTGL